MAAHIAKREAIAWAFDQHLQRPSDVGYRRVPLGYTFDGCHRSAPRRYICRIGVGANWIQDGKTLPDGPGVVYRARVLIHFRRGIAISVRRIHHASDVVLVTNEQLQDRI